MKSSVKHTRVSATAAGIRYGYAFGRLSALGHGVDVDAEYLRRLIELPESERNRVVAREVLNGSVSDDATRAEILTGIEARLQEIAALAARLQLPDALMEFFLLEERRASLDAASWYDARLSAAERAGSALLYRYARRELRFANLRICMRAALGRTPHGSVATELLHGDPHNAQVCARAYARLDTEALAMTAEYSFPERLARELLRHGAYRMLAVEDVCNPARLDAACQHALAALLTTAPERGRVGLESVAAVLLERRRALARVRSVVAAAGLLEDWKVQAYAGLN
ncbi:MAG: hypothetical protein LBS17_04115 [Actinomycetes bacterium]|jgi:hypothetical protein|nr:hypothetical protein [Actinomycetes bacterium]